MTITYNETDVQRDFRCMLCSKREAIEHIMDLGYVYEDARAIVQDWEDELTWEEEDRRHAHR